VTRLPGDKATLTIVRQLQAQLSQNRPQRNRILALTILKSDA